MADASQSVSYALLDHVPLGICVLSADFEVRFWNSCLESWTGIARSEILGTDLSERFRHFREPLYFQRLEMIFDGGPPTIFSSQLHRHLIPSPLPDGQLRIQHAVVTGIAASGQRSDAMLSIQDVTDLTRHLEEHRDLRHRAMRDMRERQRAEEERRQLEAKIQYSQKLESLGVLAGGIAHDFNNLLVGVLGNADLALTKQPAAAPSRRYLESIVDSAQRAAELSNQMLAFSGRGKFVTKILDPGELARDVVRLLEMSLGDAEIRFELPSKPLIIEADPTQIRQLLMNLVTNASDAILEQGGVITITGGTISCDTTYLRESHVIDDLPAGSYVYLDVIDDGPGMDAETLDKVFDPFFTTKFAGRGMGLAAVLGIVRGHRGTLRVDSVVGEGTVFRVLLPAASKGEELVAEAPVSEPEVEVDGAILVVDDEEAVRTVVRRVLEDRGFEVMTASDGYEAIEVFGEHADRIALVLLDMTMPRLSGHETSKALRRIREEVRVVLTSGYSEEVARNQFADQPIVGFLQKPYRPDEMVAKVRQNLRVQGSARV
ncbi:MAG: response regulator [Acidobacteriota bacterium]